jgi:hypothetical protein
VTARPAHLIPWQLIRVRGDSMTPTLLPGDWLLIAHGAPIAAGCVVVGAFRAEPDRLVVKRVARAEGSAWWLVSDNPRAGSDSRQLGAADVVGRVGWAWPGSTNRQLRSTRVAAARAARVARLPGLGWTARVLAWLPRRVLVSTEEPL